MLAAASGRSRPPSVALDQVGRRLIKVNDDETYVEDLLDESDFGENDEIEALLQEKFNNLLARVEHAVEVFEELHSGRFKQMDLLHDRSGTTAAFIIFARVLQTSYSILHLLKGRMFAGGSSLLRTVYEGHNLALYFALCPTAKHHGRHVAAWFDGQVIKDSDVRVALHEGQVGWDKELRRFFDIDKEDRQFFNELNGQYSKMTHITYPSIMASDNYVELTASTTPRVLKLGFDYRGLRRTFQLVPVLHGLSVLTWLTAEAFSRCFTDTLNLTEDEHLCLQRIKGMLFPGVVSI